MNHLPLCTVGAGWIAVPYRTGIYVTRTVRFLVQSRRPVTVELCPSDPIPYKYMCNINCNSVYCNLKAAKKQLRRGLSSPQKVSARITESLNNIGTTECHAIRSATLSEVLFWDNFDFISYVMPTSRPVPSPVPSATGTLVPYSTYWCRTVRVLVLYSRSRHHELAPPPAYS